MALRAESEPDWPIRATSKATSKATSDGLALAADDERDFRGPELSEIEDHLDRALQHCFETQGPQGQWEVLPDARLFDTGFVTYALSCATGHAVDAAVRRASRWLATAPVQRHEPLAQILDETPRLILSKTASIDLRDESLYTRVFQRKTLLLYALALHAGIKVLSPMTVAQVRAKVRSTFEARERIVLKQWSRVDLVSVHLLLEHLAPDPSTSISMSEAVKYLSSLQAQDGTFCHNPVSTAIAFLALSLVAPRSRTRKRCLQVLLDSQQPEGTWRFCTSSVWDTSLTVRSFRGHSRFRDRALAPAVEFLVNNQNEDGGWGFHADVESDNDTTSCVLLALRDHLQASHPAITRSIQYLLRWQRPDGLWNTWQSDDDRPVDDCVAHIVRALDPFADAGRIDLDRARAWLASRYRKGDGWSSGWYRLVPYSILEVGRALELDRDVAAGAMSQLRELQRPDGGWPAVSGEDSRASATGIALATLAAHLGPRDPVIQRGLRYLVDTQLDDGTWEGRPEMYGPRPLIYHLQTNTHAFTSYGMIAAWLCLRSTDG